MTMNLLGPIVINLDKKKGVQIVSKKESYTTKHIVLEEIKKNQKLEKIS